MLEGFQYSITKPLSSTICGLDVLFLLRIEICR